MATKTTVLQPKKNWIFDLDGTLTLPVHNFVEIRKALGIPLENDILEHIASLSDEEAVKAKDKLDLIEQKLAQKAQAPVGLLAMCDALASKSANMGILTRNSKSNALTTLSRIGVSRYFPEDCVLGRDDALPKPNPDGILKLLKKWNESPESTVMVGNYIFDLQTGKNADTSTVLVDFTGDFQWPELADVMVSCLSDLI